jgi:hypothetical protein
VMPQPHRRMIARPNTITGAAPIFAQYWVRSS